MEPTWTMRYTNNWAETTTPWHFDPNLNRRTQNIQTHYLSVRISEQPHSNRKIVAALCWKRLHTYRETAKHMNMSSDENYKSHWVDLPDVFIKSSPSLFDRVFCLFFLPPDCSDSLAVSLPGSPPCESDSVAVAPLYFWHSSFAKTL